MKVFISYSHEDDVFVERLCADLQRKVPALDVWVDSARIGAGDRLLAEVERAIADSDCFLAILSRAALRSRWAQLERETALILGLSASAPFVIPVVVEDCGVPDVLRTMAFADFRTDYDAGLRSLLHGIGRDDPVEGAPVTTAAPSRPRVDISRLPVTGSKVFGREDELQLLSRAIEDPMTRIVTLVALGGSGKTALVNEWLVRTVSTGRYESRRIFAWSFYAQGRPEQESVSSDDFMVLALRWFGDEEPSSGSVYERAERLARLVADGDCVLILDGIEVLQNPPGDRGGRIKDIGLAVLLRALAAIGPGTGLCVVTTRYSVTDLGPFVDRSVIEWNLGALNTDHSVELLESLGVRGTRDELIHATQECRGHALTLTLLGSYLNEAHYGDARFSAQIGPAPDSSQYGAHAARVIASYVTWLGPGPEIALLSVVSLFDRTVPLSAIAYLQRVPIAGLTTPLCNLDEATLRRALWKLRQARLITTSPSDVTDMHPMVREYFRRELRRTNRSVWTAGNGALFDYYRTEACSIELPETLEQMAPLYAAIAHGCEGGLAAEALQSVFIPRIRRGDQHFSLFRLGAISSDLTALARFFEVPYEKVRGELDAAAGAYILNETGSALRILGRLDEAAALARRALGELTALSVGGIRHARAARNLSKILMQMGRLSEAVDHAAEACTAIADVDDPSEAYISHATLGRAYHLRGLLYEADAAFTAATQARELCVSQWFGLQEAHRCDYLIDAGRWHDAVTVVFDGRESTRERLGALDYGLFCLSAGRVALSRPEGTAPAYGTEAEVWLDDAVANLESVMRQDELGFALVARAEAKGRAGQLASAEDDLGAAMLIADRTSMLALQADILLARAVLAIRRHSPGEGTRHLAAVTAIADSIGYSRLSPTIERVSRVLARMADNSLHHGL